MTSKLKKTLIGILLAGTMGAGVYADVDDLMDITNPISPLNPLNPLSPMNAYSEKYSSTSTASSIANDSRLEYHAGISNDSRLNICGIMQNADSINAQYKASRAKRAHDMQRAKYDVKPSTGMK
jgi:hypothetical protein